MTTKHDEKGGERQRLLIAPRPLSSGLTPERNLGRRVKSARERRHSWAMTSTVLGSGTARDQLPNF